MKVGFTPRETYNIFRSLRREVFGMFNHEHPITFGVRSPKTGIFFDGTIAQCDFSTEPDVPYYLGKKIESQAQAIRVNADYLPHLYEDELINILLHELSHAVTGWSGGDGHGDDWKNIARQVGVIPEPTFLVRNWKSVPNFNPFWAAAAGFRPTMDAFKGSL